MFTRWGAFVYRRRRWLVAARDRLRGRPSAPWRAARPTSLPPAAGSTRRPNRPRSPIGSRRSTVAADRRSSPSSDRPRRAPTPRPPSSRRRSRRPSRRCSNRRRHGVTGYAETARRPVHQQPGDAAYVLIGLDADEDRSIDWSTRQGGARDARRLRGRPDRLRADPAGLGATVRGGPRPRRDRLAADRGARPDPRLRLARSRRACRCSWPGWRSRPRSGVMNLVAQQTEMSIYVLNIATMLGLALAIDYSLFMTSRFREELGARADGGAGGRARGRRPPARPSCSRASRSRSGCPGCCGSRRAASPRSGSAARSSSSPRCSSA